MTNPFVNDPIAILWQAFQNLYPDKHCVCWYDSAGEAEKEGGILGATIWQENGEPPLVWVDFELTLTDALELFAHELAHVAAGHDAGHSNEWQDAFDALFVEYNRIGDELFDNSARVTVEVIDGKEAYYKENEQ